MKTWKRREDDAVEERLNRVMRRARQALYQIRRANEGERDMMLKVLLLAYGRTGRRRRELMRPLLPVEQQADMLESKVTADRDGTVRHDTEPSEDRDKATASKVVAHSELNTNASASKAGDDHRSQLPELTPQSRALAESQIRASPPDITRRNPRHLKPQVPALNSWLRPMPQVRVKNMTKAW